MPDVPPEWRMLERAVRAPRDDVAAELDESLANGPLDPVALVAHAAHHKLLPLLASLLDRTTAPLPPLLANLVVLHAANAHKARTLTESTVRLCEELRGNDVRVAVTKGLALHHVLYAADGTRYFTDVDLMVRPDDVPATARTLESCGYRVGRYDRRSRDVVPPPRSELLTYSLSPDHLPKSTRLVDDPLVPAVAVDVAYSLTWASAPWSVPMDEALAEVTPVATDAGPLPVLQDDVHFLFLVLHLFREAWHEASMDKINLAQFRDLAAFAAAAPGVLPRVRERVRSYGLDQPVSWVLTHLDRLFGEDVAARVCESPADEGWLRTIGLRRGRTGTWPGDMRARLVSGRNSLLPAAP